MQEAQVQFFPGLGRSPGGGHGYPLQYSCLENPMDRGAWAGGRRWGRKRLGHNLATKREHEQAVATSSPLGSSRKAELCVKRKGVTQMSLDDYLL